MRRFLLLLLAAASMLPSGRAFAAAPGNDDQAGATTITGLPYSDSLNNTEATLEAGENVYQCGPLSHTVWYRFTPAADVKVTIDTVGSSFDTILALWKDPIAATDDTVDCNDDDLDQEGVRTSRIITKLSAGTTYLLVAAGWAAEAGNLALHLYESASIGGTITNKDGDPISDCDVIAFNDEVTYHGFAFSRTDADGRYEAGGLSAGHYVVSVGCPGSYVVQYYNGKYTEESADRVELTHTSRITGIDLVMVHVTELDLPDLAVDGMEVSEIPLVAGDPTTGLTRSIVLHVGNHGTASAEGFTVQLRVCPQIGMCNIIGIDKVTSLGVEQSWSKTYEWNGLGMAGAVMYVATVCGVSEYTFNTNRLTMRGNVLIDAPTGIGVGHDGLARLTGDESLEPFGCYDGHDFTIFPRIQHF